MLVIALILAQAQTTTCRQVYNQTICTTDAPPSQPISPDSRPLDGYAGALGATPSYQEQKMRQQQIEAMRLQNRAVREVERRSVDQGDRANRCAQLALDLIKAAQDTFASRVLEFCES